MALAIDGSSPAIVSGAGPTVTTASFTPPAGSILLIGAAFDGLLPASGPSITDNLAGHLTYTRTDWQNGNGQAAMWWAPVSSSAAMTVSVTNGETSAGAQTTAVKIWVLTGADTVSEPGAHGPGSSSSAASIAQSYTAQATSGWGFIAVSDFDQKGAESAGTGCTSDGSANVGTAITYGFMRRTTADDTNGVSNTLNVTLPGTSTNLRWVYAEVEPAATAASGYNVPATSRHPGRGPSAARFYQTPRSTNISAQAVGLTDSGAADDTSFTVAATVPLTDSAAGSDALTVAATVPLTDAGAGSDAVSVAATAPLTDIGSADDSSVVVTATVPLADSGTAADALAVQDVTLGAAPPGPRHPGRGPTTARFLQTPRSTDVNPPTGVSVTDSGTGADAIAASATVPLADAGTGDDQLTAAVTTAATDSGSGADTAAVSAAIPATDTATGSDALGVAATVPLTDAGSAADVLSVQITSAASAATVTTGRHPGRGPTLARFLQTPRSSSTMTAILLADAGTAQECIDVHLIRPTSLTSRPSTGATARPNTGTTCG